MILYIVLNAFLEGGIFPGSSREILFQHLEDPFLSLLLYYSPVEWTIFLGLLFAALSAPLSAGTSRGTPVLPSVSGVPRD